ISPGDLARNPAPARHAPGTDRTLGHSRPPPPGGADQTPATAPRMRWGTEMTTALALLAAGLALQQPAKDEPLTPHKEVIALLRPVVKKHELPGAVAAVFRGGRLVAIGSVGVRKAGSPEPFTINDTVHIGSCTKAMTATLLAMLVEEGKLRWDT